MKILLLEDEFMLRSSIEEYLVAFSHQVSSFNDGVEVLETLKTETFDLLLLDINVPKLNGLELLEELNSLEIVTPTIFISANLDIEDISRAFELGASDYLKKPFHLKELGIRIARVKRDQEIRSASHMLLSKKYYFSKDDNLLFYNNTSQVLTRRQLQILTLLSSNIGVTVDFEKFRSYVWDNEPVDNATIRAEMSRFRKSLKEDFIINIKGIGYKIEKYFSL